MPSPRSDKEVQLAIEMISKNFTDSLHHFSEQCGKMGEAVRRTTVASRSLELALVPLRQAAAFERVQEVRLDQPIVVIDDGNLSDGMRAIEWSREQGRYVLVGADLATGEDRTVEATIKQSDETPGPKRMFRLDD
jgi:hypothetical protein